MNRLISLIILFQIVLSAQDLEYVTNVTERNLYLSFLTQYGPGFERINAGNEYNPHSRETNDIYIRPGGGYGIEGIVGSDIRQSMSAEFAVGLLRSGKVINKEHIVFDKITLRASFIYKVNIYRYHKLYFGTGFSAIQKSTLKVEQAEKKLHISYNDPKGFHIIAGLQFNYTQNLFFYGDFKYHSLGKYKIKNAKLSGETMKISEVNNKYHKLRADGIQFSFGIGYYIK